VQYKNILAMIFNEIKCHVNTTLGLVEGDASPASPLCPRLTETSQRNAPWWTFSFSSANW